MLKDFKEFIMRGNVLDLAVGVIIGGAFGAIVNSLVNDVIMPPIGALTSGVNFNDLYVTLNNKTYPSLAEALKAGAPVIAYGKFINNVITFLIIAFVIFLIVRAANQMSKPAPAAPAAPPPPMKDCPMCTMSIPAAARRCPNCTSDLAVAASL